MVSKKKASKKSATADPKPKKEATKKLSARSDFEGTEKFIGEKYVAFLKSVHQLANQFEGISPDDASLVNGYVRTVLGAVSKERTAEREEFNKEKRIKKLDERDAKMKEQMEENARLRKELNS
jgi:hypothetical protein